MAPGERNAPEGWKRNSWQVPAGRCVDDAIVRAIVRERRPRWRRERPRSPMRFRSTTWMSYPQIPGTTLWRRYTATHAQRVWAAFRQSFASFQDRRPFENERAEATSRSRHSLEITCSTSKNAAPRWVQPFPRRCTGWIDPYSRVPDRMAVCDKLRGLRRGAYAVRTGAIAAQRVSRRPLSAHPPAGWYPRQRHDVNLPDPRHLT